MVTLMCWEWLPYKEGSQEVGSLAGHVLHTFIHCYHNLATYLNHKNMVSPTLIILWCILIACWYVPMSVCHDIKQSRHDMTLTKSISIFEGIVHLHNFLAAIYLNTQETDTNVKFWANVTLPNISILSSRVNYDFFHTVRQKFWKWTSCHDISVASFPGLPRFLFFVFTRKWKSVRKTGKAWEHLSSEWRLVDARWT